MTKLPPSTLPSYSLSFSSSPVQVYQYSSEKTVMPPHSSLGLSSSQKNLSEDRKLRKNLLSCRKALHRPNLFYTKIFHCNSRNSNLCVHKYETKFFMKKNQITIIILAFYNMKYFFLFSKFLVVLKFCGI